jgi:hypothetical protein
VPIIAAIGLKEVMTGFTAVKKLVASELVDANALVATSR